MVTDDYKSRIISSFYQDIMMIIRWEASIYFCNGQQAMLYVSKENLLMHAPLENQEKIIKKNRGMKQSRIQTLLLL